MVTKVKFDSRDLATRLALGGSNKTHFGQLGSIHCDTQMRRVAVWGASDRSLQPGLVHRTPPVLKKGCLFQQTRDKTITELICKETTEVLSSGL